MLVSLFSSIAIATPITLQHASTTYANAGICSAAIDITIHDFLEAKDKLYLDLIVTNNTGVVQGSSKDVITSNDVDNLQGKAFGRVFIESENMCAADQTWTVKVKRAVLVLNGKQQDLLKTNEVYVDDFQPMRFKVN